MKAEHHLQEISMNPPHDRTGTESSQPTSLAWDHDFQDLDGVISEDNNLFSDPADDENANIIHSK